MDYKLLTLNFSNNYYSSDFFYGDDLFDIFNNLKKYFNNSENKKRMLENLPFLDYEITNIKINYFILNLKTLDENKELTSSNMIIFYYDFDVILINYLSSNKKIDGILCLLLSQINLEYPNNLSKTYTFFLNFISRLIWIKIKDKQTNIENLFRILKQNIKESERILCNGGGGPGPLQSERNLRKIYFETKVKKDFLYLFLKITGIYFISCFFTYFYSYVENNIIIKLFSFEYMLTILGILLAIYLFVIDNQSEIIKTFQDKKIEKLINEYRNSINANIKLFFYITIFQLFFQIVYSLNFDIIILNISNSFQVSIKSIIFFLFTFFAITSILIIKDLLFSMLEISKIKNLKKVKKKNSGG